MKKINLLMVAFTVIFFSYTNQLTAQSKAFINLDHYLQTEIKEGRLKGVHAAVFQNGSLVYDHFYGYRDVESKDTMQGNEEYFIQSMTKPTLLIAGGDGKNQNFKALINPSKIKVKNIALIGKDAKIIQEIFTDESIPVSIEKNLELAIIKSFELAKSGDVILLSPACASTDMFKNYVHRGQVFKDCVSRLKNKS